MSGGDSKSSAADSKRAFDLKSGAAAAASNVVVIGYGMAGKGFHCYLVSLAATHGLALYGVVASRPETQKEIKTDYPSVKVFSTVEAALADSNVDLMVIATPSGTHTALAIQCLNGGKHVVVDKPFALSLSECDKMIEAATKTRRLLTAFQNRRFDGDFMTVQKLMRPIATTNSTASTASAGSGGTSVSTAAGPTPSLGTMRWIEMAYQKGKSSRGWKAESVYKGGGRFLDLGAHMIDQCCLLFADQPITGVYARMHFDFPGEANKEVDSHAHVTLEFGDGSTAIADANSMTSIEKPRFYAVGSNGTFQKYGFDPQEAAMMAGKIDSAVEDAKFHGVYQPIDRSKPSTTIVTEKGRWRNFYENIGLVLQGKAEPLVSLASVRRAISVIDAALESVKLKKSVSVQIPPAH